MKTIELIKSDLYRHSAVINLRSFLINFLTNRGFIFMFWFRLSQSPNKLISTLAYPICFLKNRKFQIHMNPKSVKVGYGFYIGHGGPLIVHPKVIIGNNCNVSQFTTIGSISSEAAKIGNCVWIGPNVVISSKINIGDGAVIGAGSIVLKDVDANTTVAGNVAFKISDKNSARLLGSIYQTQ
ncbi:serine O-acetyltransferase [Acinetobacter sp. Marseille-Q1618]|uniref:serine O-acetyltransferase n=1 Tax=Acinetobacter sp. Marseille-Q1618 TaxID=2697502 RepID=UPI00156FB2EC|nr:serine acetyltransferase [Acinetobacter sp. Marseille-Q1618]